MNGEYMSLETAKRIKQLETNYKNMQESALQLDRIVKEKQQEIEKLKRLVQKRYYTMKEKLEVVNIFDDIQRCGIEEKDKEIERLNNIINELEIDINLELCKTRANDEYNKGLFNAFKYVLDKLQELKGDKNNDN